MRTITQTDTPADSGLGTITASKGAAASRLVIAIEHAAAESIKPAVTADSGLSKSSNTDCAVVGNIRP